MTAVSTFLHPPSNPINSFTPPKPTETLASTPSTQQNKKNVQDKKWQQQQQQKKYLRATD